jgi:hypothetical protein
LRADLGAAGGGPEPPRRRRVPGSLRLELDARGRRGRGARADLASVRRAAAERGDAVRAGGPGAAAERRRGGDARRGGGGSEGPYVKGEWRGGEGEGAPAPGGGGQGLGAGRDVTEGVRVRHRQVETWLITFACVWCGGYAPCVLFFACCCPVNHYMKDRDFRAAIINFSGLVTSHPK